MTVLSPITIHRGDSPWKLTSGCLLSHDTHSSPTSMDRKNTFFIIDLLWIKQQYKCVSKHGAKLLLFCDLTKFCTWENQKYKILLFSTLWFCDLGKCIFVANRKPKIPNFEPFSNPYRGFIGVWWVTLYFSLWMKKCLRCFFFWRIFLVRVMRYGDKNSPFSYFESPQKRSVRRVFARVRPFLNIFNNCSQNSGQTRINLFLPKMTENGQKMPLLIIRQLQRKCIFMCIFFQKYLVISKKSTNFAPAFEKQVSFNFQPKGNLKLSRHMNTTWKILIFFTPQR